MASIHMLGQTHYPNRHWLPSSNISPLRALLLSPLSSSRLPLPLTAVKSRSVLHLRTNSEPSDTSDILYPLSVQVPTLILLPPLFLFCSSLLTPSVRTFPIIMWSITMWFRFPHAPVSCVDSTSCSYDRSSPQTPVSVPAPPLNLRTPPVFKPVVSISTNQSDYCVILCSALLFCISLSLLLRSLSASVWLPSDSGLWLRQKL